MSWSGLRAAVRIARRDAVRSRGRTALVATMIGLPVLVCVAGGTLIASSMPTDETYARSVLGPGAQALIPTRQQPGVIQDARHAVAFVGDDGEPAPAQSLGVSGYAAALTKALPAGDRLVAVGAESGVVVTAGGRTRATVTEYPAADLARLTSAAVVAGRLPAAPGEVALDRTVARDSTVGVGDTITLEVPTVTAENVTTTRVLTSAPVTVVGLVVARNPFLSDQVVAPTGTVLPAVPERPGGDWGSGLLDSGVQVGWFVVGPEPLDWSHVRAANALGSVAISRFVVLHPETVGPEPAEYATDDGPAPETIALIAAIVTMALLEVVLLVGPAFAVGGRRSQRQLALVAAVGGDRRALRRVMLAGGLVVGAGASLLASVLGVGVAATIRAVMLARHSFVLPDFRLPWWVVPVAVVVGTVVAMAAAWVPARRASRVDVPAALAGRRAEAHPRRAVPIVGAAMFAVGAVAAAVGAARSQGTLLVLGVIVLELGMVAASGGIVSLAARLSRWAGVAGRFALRDAARQRGRTAPAVAAVIAAVAGLAAGAVFVESRSAHNERVYQAPLADGVSVLDLVGAPDFSSEAPLPPAVTQADYDAAVAKLRAALPVEHAYPAQVATLTDDQRDAQVVQIVVPSESRCPVLDDAASASRAEQRRHSSDPRCTFQSGGGEVIWHDRVSSAQVVVDDGSLVRHTGVPGAAAAADALAAGKVVVPSRFDLWADGTVHLMVGSRLDRPVAVPGAVADGPGLWTAAPVLPPAVAESLGLRAELAGALVTLTRAPTTAETLAARDALDPEQHGDGPGWWVEHSTDDGSSTLLLVMLGGALLLGLASTGIAVALAAAESRPDLATLSAVGASPSVRRRVAAAQAGAIAVPGSWLGVITGVALGHVVVLAHRFTNNTYNPYWSTHLPWPTLAAVAIGLPALAVGASALLTRSRLPMVRRVVG